MSHCPHSPSSIMNMFQYYQFHHFQSYPWRRNTVDRRASRTKWPCKHLSRQLICHGHRWVFNSPPCIRQTSAGFLLASWRHFFWYHMVFVMSSHFQASIHRLTFKHPSTYFHAIISASYLPAIAPQSSVTIRPPMVFYDTLLPRPSCSERNHAPCLPHLHFNLLKMKISLSKTFMWHTLHRHTSLTPNNLHFRSSITYLSPDILPSRKNIKNLPLFLYFRLQMATYLLFQ